MDLLPQGESVEAALVWVLGPDGGLAEKSKAREAVQEVLAKKDVKPRSESSTFLIQN